MRTAAVAVSAAKGKAVARAREIVKLTANFAAVVRVAAQPDRAVSLEVRSMRTDATLFMRKKGEKGLTQEVDF